MPKRKRGSSARTWRIEGSIHGLPALPQRPSSAGRHSRFNPRSGFLKPALTQPGGAYADMAHLDAWMAAPERNGLPLMRQTSGAATGVSGSAVTQLASARGVAAPGIVGSIVNAFRTVG